MPDDWVWRLLRRFGRAPAARDLSGPRQHIDIGKVDERLDNLEHKQRDIDVRLRLIERQADPRKLRDDR